MRITDRIAVVTGANRGLGRGLAQGLLRRGAARVYAIDRDVRSAEALSPQLESRLVRLDCDITCDAEVLRTTERCADADLLVNCAGVNGCKGLLAESGLDSARLEIEVNYLGTLRVSRCFVPVLTRHDDGAILTIVSGLARAALPDIGTYCVSKAALLKTMELLRAQLAPRGIEVFTALPGAIDTALIGTLSIPKMTVQEAAGQILDAFADGRHEALIGREAIELEREYLRDPWLFMRERAKA